ncbi:cation transporter [Cohnella sp. CIP 111063]|nr:cation transporter [Cohnella sp. CIP 111063]
MGHDHNKSTHAHTRSTNRKNLTIALFITTGFMIAEIIGGIWANSLALLSDAGHMFSDAFSQGLSLIAFSLAAKPVTPQRTYGFYRVEIIAAFINGLTLAVIAAYIFYEGYKRIINPPEVQSNIMLVIAFLGLVVNIVAAWVLSRGEGSKSNLNMRSAFLHVLGDLLGSAGAIVAGLLILFFGWYLADPLISIFIAVLVLFSGWRVTRESINILIGSTPKHIDVSEISKMMLEVEGVISIHDLHIWTLTSGMELLTCHIVVETEKNMQQTLLKIRKVVYEKFGIEHVTLQMETEDLKESEPDI